MQIKRFARKTFAGRRPGPVSLSASRTWRVLPWRLAHRAALADAASRTLRALIDVTGRELADAQREQLTLVPWLERLGLSETFAVTPVEQRAA